MSSMDFAINRVFHPRTVRDNSSRQDRSVVPGSWPYGISGRITALPWEGLSLVEAETDSASDAPGLSR
jgi:hypothetical protein